MDQLLTNLLEAVNDVLTAGELDDGGTFVCADEDAQRLQVAYSAFMATPQPDDELLHEYTALVASLRDEYRDDAERMAAEAFLQIRGIVVQGARFVPVQKLEIDYDIWNAEQEAREVARLDALEAERDARLSAGDWGDR